MFGSGVPTLIGKRSNLNGECCENDLCNNNQPINKRQIDFISTMGPRTTTPVFPTFTSTPPMTTEMTTAATSMCLNKQIKDYYKLTKKANSGMDSQQILKRLSILRLS